MHEITSHGQSSSHLLAHKSMVSLRARIMPDATKKKGRKDLEKEKGDLEEA